MTTLSSVLLSPIYFATACLKTSFGFFWLWLKSRRVIRIFAGFPAIALAAVFLWAILKSSLLNAKSELLTRYLTQARAAVKERDIRSARLLFRRAEQVDPGNLDLKLEFATALHNGGERSEAFQMLLTLAPIRKTGHVPAHRFLAEHPPEGPKPNQDAFRAIHLSHLVKASAATRAERSALFRLLSSYRRFSDAEALIQTSLSEYPEDRLLLAQLKSANGDKDAARREAEQACQELSMRLQKDPGQHRLRLPLAQGKVMIGNFPEAISTLCDGLRAPVEQDVSADALELAVARTHLAWISTLPIESQMIQRRCLVCMMTGKTSATTSELIDPSFESRLTDHLKTSEGRWMITAIHGNAMASSGNLTAAESLLREAHQASPKDPVVANNLAWVILQTTLAEKSRNDSTTRLEEALKLSELATEQIPDVASFVETRAQVRLAMNRPAEALRDFRRCRELGMSTDDLENTIRRLESQISE